MAKNYTIQYLSVLQRMLTDADAEILTMIEQQDKGTGDQPPAAKSTVKEKITGITRRLEDLKTDIRKLTYTQFKEKYIDHL